MCRSGRSLLADDDLRPAPRLLLVRGVDLFPVNEKDHVGVLLDGARLAQVRHERPPVVLCSTARELRQRDDRHVELLGERLERARDLGDLGRAVLALRAGRHELQVVDHHEPSLPYSRFMRRARARSSSALSAAVSSTWMRASFRRAISSVSRLHSSSSSLPVRNRVWSTTSPWTKACAWRAGSRSSPC